MLKGKIETNDDFMIMLAYNVCRLQSYNHLFFSKLNELSKNSIDELVEKKPCDIKHMEWLWEALERAKNPIYAEDKSFNQTMEEVKQYLYY